MKGFVWMGRFVSLYGILMLAGILLAAFLAWRLVKRNHLDVNRFLILAGYGLLGGLAGAKILYLALHADRISWDRIFEPDYLAALLSGGFVFYGGLIGGLAAVLLAGKIHDIPLIPYLEAAFPCLPLAQGFGRIGCYFAGCCYGIPYEGPFHVTYPPSAYAPAEIPLFPVQLLEAGICFAIAAFLLAGTWKKGLRLSSIYLYLLLYGACRFLLEYLRYDREERGSLLWFSTSQWISLAALAAGLLLLKKDTGRKTVRDRAEQEGS